MLGASVLGGTTAWFMLRKAAVSERAPPFGVDYMAIVPWGVLIHSAREPRMLRWGAITSLDVRYVPEMDSVTPLVRWSVVTLRTARETLVGRARGCLALDRLEAHLGSYASEAGKPIALDPAGSEVLYSDFEPAFSRLLDQVRAIVRAPERLPELGLSSRGYRGGGLVRLGERGIANLRDWLTEGLPDQAGDRRPLAALLAAELEATSLLEPLVSMVTAPHPFVAAVARAAALRLGADVRRVGALEELVDFVAAAELDAMRDWLAKVH
jgi:hypothetical protein